MAINGPTFITYSAIPFCCKQPEWRNNLQLVNVGTHWDVRADANVASPFAIKSNIAYKVRYYKPFSKYFFLSIKKKKNIIILSIFNYFQLEIEFSFFTSKRN